MAKVGTRVHFERGEGTVTALSCAGDAKIVFDDGYSRWYAVNELPAHLKPVKREVPEWLRKAVRESFMDNICGDALERADAYKRIARSYR